jgi:hypothetical protein
MRRVCLMAILIAGCTVGSPPAAPAALTPADLEHIVVAPDAAPEGMQHDETQEGVAVLTRPIISRQGADLVPILAQPGFVAGR